MIDLEAIRATFASVEKAFAKLADIADEMTEALLDFEWRAAWYVAPSDAWWER